MFNKLSRMLKNISLTGEHVHFQQKPMLLLRMAIARRLISRRPFHPLMPHTFSPLLEFYGGLSNLVELMCVVRFPCYRPNSSYHEKVTWSRSSTSLGILKSTTMLKWCLTQAIQTSTTVFLKESLPPNAPKALGQGFVMRLFVDVTSTRRRLHGFPRNKLVLKQARLDRNLLR